jgi:hypothetical protein
LQRQTGHQEINFVRCRRKILVDPSQQIAKRATDLRFRNQAQPNFVGDANNRLLPRARQLEKVSGDALHNLFAFVLICVTLEPIGNEQSQAIYDDNRGSTCVSKGFVDLAGLFKRAPVGGSFGAMARDPRGHFCIQALSSGNESHFAS